MMKNKALSFSLIAISALTGCSSTTSEPTTTGSVPAVTASSVASSSNVMEITDINYGSPRTSAQYLVSYSFPDAAGRFAVRTTGAEVSLEPTDDTSDVKLVNDDVAASVICKGDLRKLQTQPTYIVADRAYETTYICNLEG